MRFLREATDLAKGNYVRDKADHKEPGTAFHGENQSPAKNSGDNKICNDSPKQFHWKDISERKIGCKCLIRELRELTRIKKRKALKPHAGPDVLEERAMGDAKRKRGPLPADMALGTRVCRGDRRADNHAIESKLLFARQVLIR